MFSSLRIYNGSNLAGTECHAKPNAASFAPPTNPFVGSSDLAYPNLGSVRLHYAGLNPTANVS